MMTRIPDLAFEIDGDLLRLEQSTGGGAVAMVELHRLHLRHLAEAAGLLAPMPLPPRSHWPARRNRRHE